jgi:hypothetical protein
MPDQGYRHTQVGWVILGALAATVLLFGGILAAARLTTGGLVAAALLIATGLLFGWLRVEVDDDELRARFGIGLIGKTIALSEVRSFSSVKNQWYWGWGIRLYPGGWLYNVSGTDAVEVILRDGKRYRIGTDEPAALADALRRVVGEPAPIEPGEPAAQPRSVSRLLYVGIAAAAFVVAGAVVAAVGVQAGPPKVAVTATSVSVKSGFYSVEAPFADVTSVTLEPSLPHILRRTNGYAGAKSLRGHFDVEGLGNGQLFIEKGHPPFVFVRTTAHGFFYVNDADPARTEELYRQILEAWSKAKAP